MKSTQALKKLIYQNFEQEKFEENKILIFNAIKTKSITVLLLIESINFYYEKKKF